MKASELRKLSVEELRTKAQELRDEILNARIRHATGQLEDTTRIRRVRHDLARTETVLREKNEAHA